MNPGLNTNLIEGVLLDNPELVYTKEGNAICKFEIVVNFRNTLNDKIVDESLTIFVLTWNKVAEASAQYLRKGYRIRVRGHLKQDSWTTKRGEKKSNTYLEAMVVDFLEEGGEDV